MREVYIALFLGFLGLFGYFVPIALGKYDEDGLTKSVIFLGILCVVLALVVIFVIFQAIRYGRIHDQKQTQRDDWNMPEGQKVLVSQLLRGEYMGVNTDSKEPIIRNRFGFYGGSGQQ
jgi:hypothetical protein